MESRIECSGLSVAKELYDLVKDEIAPGTGIDPERFWAGYAEILDDMAPANRFLLEKRDRMHEDINAWYREHPGKPELPAYKAFLRELGYLVPEGGAFQIRTERVDPEIATIAGPQLVVPVSNARFALNAANARWGSLYDALYGTDMIPEDDGCEKGNRFNPVRGEKVIAMAAGLLDEIVPLAGGRDYASRLFTRRLAVKPLGYDPSIQILGPDDLAQAIRLAVQRRPGGAFNVAPAGVVPLNRALRLAGYITWRNWGEGEDYRYRQIRQRNQPGFEFKSLYLVFGLQGVLAWIISIPLLVAILHPGEPGGVAYLGVLVWLVGMLFEAVGDYQLARFKADPDNKGKVLDSGLWRYTRHPNYFGNAMIWWGFYLIALSVGGWWTIFAPLLMTFLLLKVSGVVLLEKDIAERRPAYRDYVARTNAFLPGPPRDIGAANIREAKS